MGIRLSPSFTFGFMDAAGSILAGPTVPYCGAGSSGEHSQAVPQLRDSACPDFTLLCLVFLWTSSLPPWGHGVRSPAPASSCQLQPEEWRSNWCHPSSGLRRWVTLVTGLSVPSSCCFSYPQCKAEELIPLWGRCEGGWHGRTRV